MSTKLFLYIVLSLAFGATASHAAEETTESWNFGKITITSGDDRVTYVSYLATVDIEEWYDVTEWYSFSGAGTPGSGDWSIYNYTPNYQWQTSTDMVWSSDVLMPGESKTYDVSTLTNESISREPTEAQWSTYMYVACTFDGGYKTTSTSGSVSWVSQ